MKEKFDELIKGPVPVLVDFSAEWCGPCKMMAPVLRQLKESMADRIKIIKVDVDKNRELAARYRIHNVPSIMLFQNGITKWSGVGVMSSNHLENVINNSCSIVSN
jgi:thioredoxin 1